VNAPSNYDRILLVEDNTTNKEEHDDEFLLIIPMMNPQFKQKHIQELNSTVTNIDSIADDNPKRSKYQRKV
jgi:hypothetical protein